MRTQLHVYNINGNGLQICVVSRVIFGGRDLLAAEEEARRHHQSETCQGLGGLVQGPSSRKPQDLHHALLEACLQSIHVAAGQQDPAVSATEDAEPHHNIDVAWLQRMLHVLRPGRWSSHYERPSAAGMLAELQMLQPI